MKTAFEGQEIEVAAGFFIIGSNKGNHSGYNRVWKQWNCTFATRKDARRFMAEKANEENQSRPGKRGYTRTTDDSAWVDGETYAVVNGAELLESIKGTGTNLANIHAITVLEA